MFAPSPHLDLDLFDVGIYYNSDEGDQLFSLAILRRSAILPLVRMMALLVKPNTNPMSVGYLG